MIDIFAEELIDLKAASREQVFRSRQTGKSASISKMYRLALRGSLGLSGKRIRLEVVKAPGGFITSREAIRRFIANLSGSDTGGPEETSKARQKQIDAAVAELIAAGFEVGPEPPRSSQ